MECLKLEDSKELWLNEAMLEFNEKLDKDVLNIINAPAGSGKSTFIFQEFLEESYKYVNGIGNKKYIDDLDKVLYVCDTNMLKSSILNEDEGITKILEKGDLLQAMETKTLENILEGEIGYIKVITYSTFGWLLKQKGSRHIILNYYDVIIMDEMQNLFKYANRFDNGDNGKPYGTVIDYLPTLINSHILLIALSATTGRIFNGIRDMEIYTNTIFKCDERKQIKQYHDKLVIETNDIMNELKFSCLRHEKYKDDFKIMIYTNTIMQSKKYKTFLENAGLKAEWLCSINNTILNADNEKIPLMNEEQIRIRDRLLYGAKGNEDSKGTLPDDLDVLIINSGYETGWNLRDNRVQYVYIDSTDDDTHIQARNRVRHDISLLVKKVRTIETGEILEYGNYRQDEFSGRYVNEYSLAKLIEDKYIGVKLTNADKKYLVNKYAMHWSSEKNVNWKTFQIDLNARDFIVQVTPHGTYIFKNGNEIKKDVRVGMSESLINWIENEWDKKRITCQDIMDILDIGKKSFNKIIKNDEILQYFKEHKYTVGTVKDSKTKYLMKY